MCVHSDEFWLLPFSWRSLTQSLCLWVEVFIWRGNNELGGRSKRKGEGAAGLLGPLQLQLVRLLPFNLPRHILQKDVARSQLKVQFQGEGAADRTCRKRERKAWLSWSVCVCGGVCVCLCWGHTQILQQITRVIHLRGVAFQTERTTLRMSNISNSCVTPCYVSPFPPQLLLLLPLTSLCQNGKWQNGK